MEILGNARERPEEPVGRHNACRICRSPRTITRPTKGRESARKIHSASKLIPIKSINPELTMRSAFAAAGCWCKYRFAGAVAA
jgi:hypothetical protein